jgi:hypothetical protein
MWPLIGMGVTVARNVDLSTDLKPIPELALCHHASCIEAVGYANRRGKHSAAMVTDLDALRSSKLLFQRAEWWAQPTPNFWFKPGHDWMDEA